VGFVVFRQIDVLEGLCVGHYMVSFSLMFAFFVSLCVYGAFYNGLEARLGGNRARKGEMW
jgi:hypothetical protein